MEHRQRVLITGAAGFIGSHLAEHMVASGWEVTGVDNFCDFYDPLIKRNNLKALNRAPPEKLPAAGEISPMIKAGPPVRQRSGTAAPPGEGPSFQLQEGDFRDRDFLARVFDMARPHLVVHLGAMAGVRPSIEDPPLYFSVNVDGTLAVLEQCRAKRVSRCVFASSSSVYGSNVSVPFRETDPVDHPISPYAATKKAGELLCHTYHHLFGLSIACLRFFTVYGPRQRPDLAIHKFARLMEAGRPIPFFGDGSTRRDYTYIDDIIQGVEGAIRWTGEGAVPRYGVFNLGESRTVSLKELVELLERTLDRPARVDRQPDQPGDVPVTFADITRAREVLGYAPTVAIEEGIRRFVAWLRRPPEV